MGKDWYKDRKNKSATGAGKSDFYTTDYLRAVAYHPTNGQPTTPVIGQRLTPTNKYQYQNAVPGFYAITYLPVFGSNDSMNDNSTFRNVGRNIWSSLRNFCTTAVGYQPGDVINTLLQAGQIPAMLKNVKRRMAAAFMSDVKYNLYNREAYFVLVPGATETQRRQDIADMSRFVARYNACVQLYNSVACPDMFPIFHRWEYLNEAIFTDVDLDSPDGNKFAQYIYFEPQCWYQTKLADPSVIPGTEMRPALLTNGISGALTQIEDLLNYMFEDSSFRQILGDLRNTFGDTDVYKADTITVEDVSTSWKPTFSMDVLYSLHNATVVPVTAPTINVNVQTGALEGTYLVTGASTRTINKHAEFTTKEKVFNGMKWGVTTEEFIKFTPWTLQQSAYSPTGGILSPGPEILTNIRIWGYDYPLGSRQLMYVDIVTNHFAIATDDVITVAWLRNVYGYIAAWENCAYLPILYFDELTYDASENITSSVIIGYGAELEIPVLLNEDNVAAWHDGIREGLWGLPKEITFKTRS